ncbi:MAG: acetyltransferase [Ramlibacter sp.]|nr:acetyltransferase [Ramlibacter sp.]
MSAYSFRPIARSDFPLLAGWLVQPHIQRWWADDPSPQALEADYGGTIDGGEPAQVFIAYRDDVPFGLAQSLRLAEYPGYPKDLQALVEVPPFAGSIDYFVGDPLHTGRGRGTEMLRAFVRRLWRDDPRCETLLVPVHAENIASWRALERIGFVRVAAGAFEPDNPADTWDHYILRLDRPSLDGSAVPPARP